MFYSAKTGGFYPLDSAVVPEDAVEITSEAYEDLFHGQGLGMQIVAGANGVPELLDPRPPITLENVKFDLKSSVDSAAEAARLRYITPGAGQAMTYSQKADEAARFLAATSPEAADYPMLNAEVGITAADLHGVAEVVNASYLQWQTVGAMIEGIRLRAKKGIEFAATSEAAQAIVASIAWP
ncbi:hypothetical protein [Rhizobium tumorigenes]|uniref:hypothetical protein n=1 Tax=Rhizobium tumorigenes TaxID=2041385 RepID=UPI00241DE894|nr:hypothetical protein [Rhizobium tumorigenes]WFS01580.1 hypothetical protein PR016_02800 [Rhizobium tumorigenes]